MNNDLVSLDSSEKQLLARVLELTGTIEEKYEKLGTSGVYEKYAQIFDRYVSLLSSQVEGAEAMKRAVFLYWYEQAEPSCYTGLAGLAERPSSVVLFDELESNVTSGQTDPEMRWMLHYYYSIAEWVFTPHLNRPALRGVLPLHEPGDMIPSGLRGEDFADRGQMGFYWQSVVNSRLNQRRESAVDTGQR